MRFVLINLILKDSQRFELFELLNSWNIRSFEHFVYFESSNLLDFLHSPWIRWIILFHLVSLFPGISWISCIQWILWILWIFRSFNKFYILDLTISYIPWILQIFRFLGLFWFIQLIEFLEILEFFGNLECFFYTFHEQRATYANFCEFLIYRATELPYWDSNNRLNIEKVVKIVMTLLNWGKISKSFRTRMVDVMKKPEGNWEAKYFLENDDRAISFWQFICFTFSTLSNVTHGHRNAYRKSLPEIIKLRHHQVAIACFASVKRSWIELVSNIIVIQFLFLQ